MAVNNIRYRDTNISAIKNIYNFVCDDCTLISHEIAEKSRYAQQSIISMHALLMYTYYINCNNKSIFFV